MNIQPSSALLEQELVVKEKEPGGAYTFVSLLLSADIIFILLHYTYHYTPYLNSDYFSLAKNQGFAELFMYLKVCLIIVVLVALLMKTYERVFLLWAILFSCIILTHAYQIHHLLGQSLGKHFGIQPLLGIKLESIGELLLMVWAGILCILLARHVVKCGGILVRKVTFDLFFLTMIFVGFGIGVGLLRALIGNLADDRIIATLGASEEMVMLSFFCWYLLDVYERVAGITTKTFASPLRGVYVVIIQVLGLPKALYQRL